MGNTQTHQIIEDAATVERREAEEARQAEMARQAEEERIRQAEIAKEKAEKEAKETAEREARYKAAREAREAEKAIRRAKVAFKIGDVGFTGADCEDYFDTIFYDIPPLSGIPAGLWNKMKTAGFEQPDSYLYFGCCYDTFATFKNDKWEWLTGPPQRRYPWAIINTKGITSAKEALAQEAALALVLEYGVSCIKFRFNKPCANFNRWASLVSDPSVELNYRDEWKAEDFVQFKRLNSYVPFDFQNYSSGYGIHFAAAGENERWERLKHPEKFVEPKEKKPRRH